MTQARLSLGGAASSSERDASVVFVFRVCRRICTIASILNAVVLAVEGDRALLVILATSARQPADRASLDVGAGHAVISQLIASSPH